MIEHLLKKIAQNLDKNHIPYTIIGGQAVLLYGTPRLTRDIDITLGIDTDRFSMIDKICGESGLKILPENPENFAIETKVCRQKMLNQKSVLILYCLLQRMKNRLLNGQRLTVIQEQKYNKQKQRIGR